MLSKCKMCHIHHWTTQLKLYFITQRLIRRVGGLPFNLSLHKIVCPVSCIRLYLQLRPKCRGSLFCHISGSPVTRYQVVSVFNMLLEKLGLDTKLYKTHSFRIGAASNAWASGASQQSIAIEGRWKSACLLNYLRQ